MVHERTMTGPWQRPLRAVSNNSWSLHSAPRWFFYTLSATVFGITYFTYNVSRVPGCPDAPGGSGHTYTRRTAGIVGDDFLGPKLVKGVDTVRPHKEGQEDL